MAYPRLRNKENAIADMKKAISLNPDQGSYYYFLSWLYMGSKQHDQAIVLLTELLSRKPGESRAYYYRSRAFHHKKEYDEALADINRAIELDPGSSSFYHWRAVTHNQMGHPDKAEKDCLNAIALKDKYPSPYFLLSNIYEKQKKPERSAAILTKLIRVGTGQKKKAYYLGQAFYRRGMLMSRQGHGSAALKDFEAACKHGYKSGCRQAAKLKKGV
jgi:tetratricopeptide (TPR) repeat protein